MAAGASEINEGIKERIRSLIGEDKGKKQGGINQKALADAIGIPEGTLSGWLSKEARRIPADVIIAICKFYGVSPVWLLTGDEESARCSLSGPVLALVAAVDGLSDFQVGQVVGYADALRAEMANKKEALTSSDTKAI